MHARARRQHAGPAVPEWRPGRAACHGEARRPELQACEPSVREEGRHEGRLVRERSAPMSGKGRIVVAAVAVGTVIAGGLGVAALVTRRPAANAATKSHHPSTATVERRDLVETES